MIPAKPQHILIDYNDGGEDIIHVFNDVQVKVYPKITSGELIVEGNYNNEKVHLTLRNILGKAVFYTEFSETKSLLELAHLPKGPYFVELAVGGAYLVKKIILA